MLNVWVIIELNLNSHIKPYLKDPARGHKIETYLKNKLKTPEVAPTSIDILGKIKNNFVKRLQNWQIISEV